MGVKRKGPLVSSLELSATSFCALSAASVGCNLRLRIFGSIVQGTGGMMVPFSRASGPGCSGTSHRCDSISSCLTSSHCSPIDRAAAAPWCCWINSRWTSRAAWRMANGTLAKRRAVPINSCKICTCNAGQPLAEPPKIQK